MTTGFPLTFTSPALGNLYTSVDITGLVADRCCVSAVEVERTVEAVCSRVVDDLGSREAVAGEYVVRWRRKNTPFGSREECLVATLYTAFAAEVIYNLACEEVLLG